jgi:hypothetical protein
VLKHYQKQTEEEAVADDTIKCHSAQSEESFFLRLLNGQWLTKMSHYQPHAAVLRKRVFAGGLLRLERLRLTLGVRDGALAAGKPGEAGGEDEGE